MKYPRRVKKGDDGIERFIADEDTLEDLIINHALDNKLGTNGATVLELIIACRKLDRILQYIQTPLYPGGYWRTSYKLHGTESGRTSGGKALDSLLEISEDGKGLELGPKLGGSLQTIPKHGFLINGERYGRDIRSMFVPRPGNVFIEGDYSQAEARVVAVLSEDYELLNSFDYSWMSRSYGT